MPQNPAEHRVALVYMPWGSIVRPSIAAGILKQCAHRAGFPADVHYLNLHFAQRIGFELYEAASNSSAFFPEWFFSTHLFGPAGLGLLENRLADLNQNQAGRDMAAAVASTLGNSVENCERVVEAVPAFIDDCMNRIDWSSYRVVGFSVTFAQTLASLLLAKNIKARFPEVTIVFGGANVDSDMGVELLRWCDWVDYVVHGEAELSFPALLREVTQALSPSSVSVPGVSQRLNGAVQPGHKTAVPLPSLDNSPPPDYTEYFQEIEGLGIDKKFSVIVPFESSRGCWWGAKKHCTFCGLNGGTMSFRSKTPDRVFDELLDLSRRHRCLTFNAVDNILDMDYFKNVLPRLAEAGTDISIFYEVKANLSREQVRALAAAGITRIQPGIESLNSELLQLMRKGITTLQNIQLLKWCFEYGIEPSWNILFGFPGERPSHYDQYPQLMRRLFHLAPPAGLSPVIFERFSPYHFDRSRFNLHITPLTKYRFLYPDNLVNLDDIAYYFEGKWEGQSENHFSYVPAIQDTFDEWQRLWQHRKAVLHFERGPGFLILHDSRPERPGAEPRMRRLKLDCMQTEIYLFCDQGRSLSSICAMAAENFPNESREAQVEALLGEFVERGLMYSEGHRYLSLAVHKHRQHIRSGMSVAHNRSIGCAVAPSALPMVLPVIQ